MACNASKASLLRVIAKRGYAAIACPRPVGEAAEVHSKVLENGVVVAAAESGMPVSRISVLFRAGSRNESYENQGAAHMLRMSLGLSAKNVSGFAITRNIEQIGGSISCTNDREIVSYTVEMTEDNIETGLCYLQEAIQPAFKPWELAATAPSLKIQIKAVSPKDRAIELVHKAAFRTGLGNSIYIPKYQIGKISSESLMHYVCNNFTANRAAVVGIGIECNTLSGFAQALDLPTGGSKDVSSNYYGGDARKDKGGHTATVAVAGQGCAFTNQKDYLAYAILQQAVGGGSATKRGSNGGVFGKALASVAADSPVSLSTLNANYADAGLFGFVVSADTKIIGKAVDALTRSLKSGAVSAQDVNRAKAILKANVLDTYSSDRLLISEMGVQAVMNKQVIAADALIAAIDGITQQQVQDAAKKVGSSKLSIGAFGNLSNVPYASDLA